ncbi:phosphoribosyltransferase [Anabaena sp. UHCC 0253]|uniref:phosphoribosyltransferase n=1 Tax=Anabaena sp. UHCC 0253 TaxID=2590019 RepID=UPI001445A7EC|nr:phosphoribosyltransferase [Anabaena sp. UHCC 0253]MTJ53036.1 phosphoribosyltransferase [Anabaena sp. UHCC 0253]
MSKKFSNRTQAGQMLAQHLKAYINQKDIVVLALPRGGVPVAFEIAKLLNAPLDVCIVRKLGVPGHKELAMGAIASQNIIVFNHDVIESLGIDTSVITNVVNQELLELRRREKTYRDDQPPININNKTIIIVDDGIATAATMRAALAILRQQQPAKIIIAVPVAPLNTCEELSLEVDDLVCLQSPEIMSAIGWWYEDFTQTTDNEVRTLLDGV